MLLECKPQQGFSFSLPPSSHPFGQRLRSATVRLPQLGKFSPTIGSESEPVNLKLSLFPTLITFQSQRMQFRACVHLQILNEFRNAFFALLFPQCYKKTDLFDEMLPSQSGKIYCQSITVGSETI